MHIDRSLLSSERKMVEFQCKTCSKEVLIFILIWWRQKVGKKINFFPLLNLLQSMKTHSSIINNGEITVMLYVKNTSGGKQMPFHKLSVDGTNIYTKSLGVPKYCYTVG